MGDSAGGSVSVSFRKDGRRVIHLVINPDLYDRIQKHCEAVDQPLTPWVRELIKRELESQPIK